MRLRHNVSNGSQYGGRRIPSKGTPMKVLVIGATGRTGRLIVDAALGHGHDVTAFVHVTETSFDPRVRVARGDVLDFDDVSAAVEGHHAVAVAIGRRTGTGPFHAPAVANVVHAMALHQVRRLAVLSAAGTFARTDKRLSLAFRALIATTMRGTYDDLEDMERRIMASALDWSIIRPVGLTDAPASGDYRISLSGQLVPKASRISRGDVAGVMLKALESDSYLRRAVVIAD